jgi:hypothetical protein
MLGAAMVLAACTGTIGERPDGSGSVGEGDDALCLTKQPGESPIRRMTRFEYNNTVRDLLGDTSEPASTFVVEEEALGFNNQASALGVTQLLAEQYMEASEAVATNATAKLDELLGGCDPASAGDEVCGQEFVESFGPRAFRRPLQASEIDRLMAVFSWGLGEYDFKTGIELVIQTALQSPHFLYRVEFGMPDPVEANVVQLNHYEVASRLSYMLWSSMPDDELLAAAAAGELATPEQIAAQARRMLDDDKARAAVANFHTQWLQLGNIESVNKDPATYPDYDATVRTLWKAETEAFLDYVVFEGEGDVTTLLTAPYSLMNAELAAFYGIDGPTGDAFELVELDAGQRAGFLTHASLLAVHAKPNQSSPVHRGKFVREQLLCQILQPPPPDLMVEAPEVDPTATTREQFAEHSTNPACSGCHQLMDPIGFGFEHYDGIGKWRDLDHGIEVDASGELVQTDIDGEFDGAVELAQKLAQSEQVRECVATQWFRFGYGRAEQPEDACNLERVQTAFATANYDIKELLVALTQTDAFMYRLAVVAEGP